MKFVFSLLLFAVIFCSCRYSRCVADKGAVDDFNKNMELIRSFQEKNVQTYKEDHLSALVFLTNVTGIPSRAEYSHAFGYRNQTHYFEDMQAWKKWLDKNKCGLTRAKIDSALSNNRAAIQH